MYQNGHPITIYLGIAIVRGLEWKTTIFSFEVGNQVKVQRGVIIVVQSRDGCNMFN